MESIIYFTSNTKPMLEKELEFYRNNQEELVEEFNNKFIVIMERKVIGAFKTYNEAYFGALKHGKSGAFLIQYCSVTKGTYSETFPSHVIIKLKVE